MACEELNNTTSIALGRGDVVVGVDTHKDEHVAVALDGLGGMVGDFALVQLPTAAKVLAWADDLGAVAVFGTREPAPTEAAWPGSCGNTAAR